MDFETKASYADSAKAGALFGAYVGTLLATISVTAAIVTRVLR